jgi:hypothetical protein
MIIEKSSQFCVRTSRPVPVSSVPSRSIQSRVASARAAQLAEQDSWQPVGDVVGNILRSIAPSNQTRLK